MLVTLRGQRVNFAQKNGNHINHMIRKKKNHVSIIMCKLELIINFIIDIFSVLSLIILYTRYQMECSTKWTPKPKV